MNAASSTSSSGAGGAAGQSGSSSVSSGGGGSIALECDPNDETLLACFPFDGDALDKANKGNVVSSVGVTFAPGMNGQAGSFIGSSQVSINNGPQWDVSQYTVELWYNQRSYGTTRMGLFDSDQRFGMFVYGNGDLRCSRDVAVYVIQSGMPLDTWTHVACTFDGTSLRMYINGVLSQQIAAPMVTPGGSIAIGSNAPSGDGFDGLIDEVHVWNVARSAADICKSAGNDSC